MLKAKSVFICQNCGAQSLKWIGKCPSCNEWNTYEEEIIADTKSKTINYYKNITKNPVLISDINTNNEKRIDTNNKEFNRILGGGLIPGSVVLIGGEPGIGKSTLLLQIALKIKEKKILYISGEESYQQLKIRANRVGIQNEQCYILNETLLENIFLQIKEISPHIIIIDSIQTIHSQKIDSSPATISQVRECTNELFRFAKETSIPVLLVSHINKEGSLAGPKVLEHIVDTVIQFEGDKNYMYRILRATKNRFGSTSELGIYEMKGNGLIEVGNVSELLLTHQHEKLSGIAISSTIEGIRPFLIEIQALVSSSAYGIPQRSTTGFDLRRLNMLLAVLEKRAGFRLATKDVFLNIAGGIKVNDPGVDLAVIIAILTSNHDIPVDQFSCFSGEVGLSGEIRAVNRIEQRISEAEKLGFKYIYISSGNKKNLDISKFSIKIIFVSKIADILKILFRK
ncbi:MAG: DNA repair protein RadA [Bacteroidales bacterium]|nr:DNA repair protein RadA [Bacteroidales bacterium]